MPLSVRLAPELEARIDAHSKETGLSKSRIIARGVQEYLDMNTGPSLYELALDVLGDSGVGRKISAPLKRAHSQTRRKDYRAYIKKKHAGRTGARG
jgi:predicted DNA-binding protein